MPIRSSQTRFRSKQQSGIALVTALGVALVILALLMVVTNMTLRSSRVSAQDFNTVRLGQMADGYSDWARLTLAGNYTSSKLALDTWLNKISPGRGNTPAAAPQVINPTDPRVSALAGKHARSLDGLSLRWQIKGVSPAPTGSTAWVELAATAEDSSGNSQTIVRTVQFGRDEIFDLALLTEKVDCMFCHLQVNGDVGSIGLLRPGWGTEGGSGIGSGKGSKITGDVYASGNVTADRSGPMAGRLNDADVMGTVNANYTGSKLPQNDDGSTAFPGLDRADFARTARGSISGGASIKTVATGGTWGGATSSGSISNTFDGNLVLEGTAANPIVLSGDVYVTGDVVIKGVVTGRGAIYSGRNVYVAGNLTNKNKADKPNQGVCTGIGDVNECAKKNIAANKDETRISAGNNIIMGDWTESDAAGNKLSMRDRQAADYYRSQFGLNPNSQRYIRKGSSEELRFEAGKYYDQAKPPREVPASEVKTIAWPSDPYRDLMAPGSTDSTGTFKSWMSDAQYKAILGQENMSYNTWRSSVSAADLSGATPADKLAQMVAELEASGFPVGSPDTLMIASAVVNGKPISKMKYSGIDKNGQPVTGYADYWGNDLRVAVNDQRAYTAEVTQLDAFLYANQRIAGKLSPRGGYVNGGLIAREIGVLAPGRNNGSGWWATGADYDKYTKCDPVGRPTDAVPDAGMAGTECNMAINYDYRLRNGGYGYNLFLGLSGTSLEWQLDLTGNQKVGP